MSLDPVSLTPRQVREILNAIRGEKLNAHEEVKEGLPVSSRNQTFEGRSKITTYDTTISLIERSVNNNRADWGEVAQSTFDENLRFIRPQTADEGTGLGE